MAFLEHGFLFKNMYFIKERVFYFRTWIFIQNMFYQRTFILSKNMYFILEHVFYFRTYILFKNMYLI